MTIFAIIVTFNPDQTLLQDQYKTLREQVDKIIYVDNSTLPNQANFDFVDESRSVIIRNNKNLGLGYAQNQGVIYSIKNNADFVLLFDQDSIPSVDFVSQLMKVYKESCLNKKVGLVGPAIRSAYNNTIINEPGIILLPNGTIYKIPLKKITEVSYCIASGSLIPTKVLKDVGLIKEELFIDVLDLEWCLRAKRKGYVIIQTDVAYISHRLGDGCNDKINSHSPLREYYIVRNNIWLTRQDYIPQGYRLRKNVSTLYRIFLTTIRGQWNYVKQQLKGVRDGWKL